MNENKIYTIIYENPEGQLVVSLGLSTADEFLDWYHIVEKNSKQVFLGKYNLNSTQFDLAGDSLSLNNRPVKEVLGQVKSLVGKLEESK